jgi:hypothetical protein
MFWQPTNPKGVWSAVVTNSRWLLLFWLLAVMVLATGFVSSVR